MKILRSSLDLAYYKIVALNFFFGFSSLCTVRIYPCWARGIPACVLCSYVILQITLFNYIFSHRTSASPSRLRLAAAVVSASDCDCSYHSGKGLDKEDS